MPNRISIAFALSFALALSAFAEEKEAAKPGDNTPPEGFIALFNGKDLTNWKGLLKGPNDNPVKRAALKPEELEKLQKEADEFVMPHWKVVDGLLIYDGKARSLATAKDYTDFEMYVDWKI